MPPARSTRFAAIAVVSIGIIAAGIMANRTGSNRHPQDPADYRVAESQANVYTYNRQQTPSVDIDADGNTVVVWASRRQEAGTSGIFARLYGPAGKPITAEVHVNMYLPDSQVTPDVACGDADQTWVTWQSFGQDGDQGGIVARRLRQRDAQLVPAGNEIPVNQTRRGHQWQPTVSVSKLLVG